MIVERGEKRSAEGLHVDSVNNKLESTIECVNELN